MFSNIVKKNSSSNFVVFLGAPEAEAEAIDNSRMPLSDVYEDYHLLSESLSAEKFIVIARKGCGKSAFAEYVNVASRAEPNFFCCFIKQGQINLETVVQIGKLISDGFEKENFFKWLIYTNVLSMFLQNEAIKQTREYDQLKRFFEKNSGYIKIHDSEIKEYISSNGLSVHLEYFKRFMNARFRKDIQIRSEKAPFYKLLPHLEYVIKNAMVSPPEVNNQNKYVVFFDDLDIGFDANDDEKVQSLMALIRACKYINNDVFGKNHISAKVVLLLRSDVVKCLNFKAADAAKLFSSYSVAINWYEDKYGKSYAEGDLSLRRFINKRISYALKTEYELFEERDPWTILVNFDNAAKSSFKYVVDHTLFRPRDLLLFFLPLSRGGYSVPLNKNQINNLLKYYSAELVSEVKNELIAFYEQNQIHMIFNALRGIHEVNIRQDCSCSYSQAVRIIKQNCDFSNPEIILSDLFERSLIGTYDSNTMYHYFKCREPINSSVLYSIKTDHMVVIQAAIKIYMIHQN